MASIDYLLLNIRGMHYVRKLKNKDGNRIFYMLFTPHNKPIKNVFDYIKI